MSNQLDRFQGLSETRWPTPSLHDEPSGEGRKALSRFINEYIAELEKSDAELLSRRRRTTTAPPKAWEDQSPKLPMSRQDYIKRQNALFRELTGHQSWSEMSSLEAARDSRDKELMTTIELYMAALDEKIYMSADYTRAIIGVRDKLVRDEVDRLRSSLKVGLKETLGYGQRRENKGIAEVTTATSGADSAGESSGADTLGGAISDLRENPAFKTLLHTAVELRDMYRDLWMQHSQLSHQRDTLEVEMSHLRHDHALQFAKVLRLEYATHSLGQRLVDAQSLRTENDNLKEELAKQQRENEALQSSLDAVNARYAAQQENIEQLTRERAAAATASGTGASSNQVMALESRVQQLYTELAKLKASRYYLDEHSQPPETPLETLDRALTLLEIGKDDVDKRITSLIESFAQQYRAREHELLTKIACLEQEKQIVIARCEKLERESSEANSDLSYLEQRTLSLVLMLKSVRASLDGAAGGEKTAAAATSAELNAAKAFREESQSREATSSPQANVKANHNGNKSTDEDDDENDDGANTTSDSTTLAAPPMGGNKTPSITSSPPPLP